MGAQLLLPMVPTVPPGCLDWLADCLLASLSDYDQCGPGTPVGLLPGIH